MKEKENKPVSGKQYRLTGGPDDICIANGNTWEESMINHDTVLSQLREDLKSLQRWDPAYHGEMNYDDSGEWVSWDDIEYLLKKSSPTP